jgi:hypothetical protein
MLIQPSASGGPGSFTDPAAGIASFAAGDLDSGAFSSGGVGALAHPATITAAARTTQADQKQAISNLLMRRSFLVMP